MVFSPNSIAKPFQNATKMIECFLELEDIFILIDELRRFNTHLSTFQMMKRRFVESNHRKWFHFGPFFSCSHFFSFKICFFNFSISKTNCLFLTNNKKFIAREKEYFGEAERLLLHLNRFVFSQNTLKAIFFLLLKICFSNENLRCWTMFSQQIVFIYFSDILVKYQNISGVIQ